MPPERETDEELQPGLPLSESLCGCFSQHLYLSFQAPLPMVAGGYGGSYMWKHLVATHVTGEHAGVPTATGHYQTPQSGSDSHSSSAQPLPLFFPRHIMDLNMNAVKEKNYGGLSESLR